MRSPADVPTYRPNLYSSQAITDPYPHYDRLRELGPVVWLSKHRVYALPRYAECKAVLRDDRTFLSGDGVGLNPLVNRLSRGTTLTSDGDEHDKRRKLVAHRLLPRALRTIGEAVQRQADELVAAAVARQQVDGVEDLATALPLSVVPELVGWPEDGRKNLLRWSTATFDALGPINRYAAMAVPASLQMLWFSKQVVRRRAVIDGSMGHDILVAADAGKLPLHECSALMVDYLVPSLDTTISGIANALALFAAHPDQWAALRGEPSRLANAVNEVLRYESPLRAFTRKALQRSMIAGGRARRCAGACAERVGQPRRTRVGQPRPLRHPPRHQPATGLRARSARVRRPGVGPSGDAGDAVGADGTSRPHRDHRSAQVGTEQRHSLLRAAAAAAHFGLSVVPVLILREGACLHTTRRRIADNRARSPRGERALSPGRCGW